MRKVVITGGAGFIGVNLAELLLRRGDCLVVIYDNLSRPGVENNLQYLISRGYENLRFVKGDIRDYKALREILEGCETVYHLAAQVAVTSSVADPVEDFRVNAEGTLYLLEAIRKESPGAVMLFASTNKVYGQLSGIRIEEEDKRYVLADRGEGIGEDTNLDFHSPYGNSKGSADQYVRDYYRVYGINTVVFRQSCIVGPFQYGNEDQGWVANFISRSILGRKINIYGDGKQVRDLLEVSDLLAAYDAVLNNIQKASGQIYNIGGGPSNTLSILELLDVIKTSISDGLDYGFLPWRQGDQKIFVSDNSKLKSHVDWQPCISVEKSIERLSMWIKENIGVIKDIIRGGDRA